MWVYSNKIYPFKTSLSLLTAPITLPFSVLPMKGVFFDLETIFFFSQVVFPESVNKVRLASWSSLITTGSSPSMARGFSARHSPIFSRGKPTRNYLKGNRYYFTASKSFVASAFKLTGQELIISVYGLWRFEIPVF